MIDESVYQHPVPKAAVEEPAPPENTEIPLVAPGPPARESSLSELAAELKDSLRGDQNRRRTKQ